MDELEAEIVRTLGRLGISRLNNVETGRLFAKIHGAKAIPWLKELEQGKLIANRPDVYELYQNFEEAYDMRRVVEIIFDQGSFFPVHLDFAPNALVGFARLHGQAVGVIANQPAVMAGVLDIDASVKGARFIRFCE